jgi:DNA-directed RNA polymerase beta subunit
LTQADQTNSWVVIGSFFQEKGLVRQQLDSFNQFITNTLQDLVSHRTIELRVQNQYKPGQDEVADREVATRTLLLLLRIIIFFLDIQLLLFFIIMS